MKEKTKDHLEHFSVKDFNSIFITYEFLHITAFASHVVMGFSSPAHRQIAARALYSNVSFLVLYLKITQNL